MQGVTYEQFSTALGAMTVGEIRRQLQQGYGIELEGKIHGKEALIKAAWERLTTAAPSTSDEHAAPAAEGQDPAPPAPSTAAARRFQVRCTGVATRWRVGRLWTRERIELTEDELTAEEWASLRADRRLEIRDLGGPAPAGTFSAPAAPAKG